MKKFKKGDEVRMSQKFKDGNLQWMTEHILEFKNCTGIVEDRVFPNCSEEEAPEINVRWKPSNLVYGYHPEYLTYSLRKERKLKLNNINFNIK